MRQIQLREEDEQLSSLVSEVEAGESVTILRSGKPVARIIPFPEEEARPTGTNDDERKAAIERLKAIMDEGLNLGGVWNGREELYERD